MVGTTAPLSEQYQGKLGSEGPIWLAQSTKSLGRKKIDHGERCNCRAAKTKTREKVMKMMKRKERNDRISETETEDSRESDDTAKDHDEASEGEMMKPVNEMPMRTAVINKAKVGRNRDVQYRIDRWYERRKA